MKKWILASLAAILCAPAVSFAQGDMLFHIKAGVNFSNVTIEDIEDNPTPEASAILGIAGGVGFTAGLSDMFAIRAEMLYSMKGATLGEVTVGGIPVSPEQEVTVNYIDIPITAMLRFPGQSATPNIFLGPVFSAKMGDAKFVVDGNEVELEGTDDGIRGFDLGATIGAGVDFDLGGNMLGIDARYTLGLTNILEDDDSDNDPFEQGETKFNVVTVLLSYTFDLSGRR